MLNQNMKQYEIKMICMQHEHELIEQGVFSVKLSSHAPHLFIIKDTE